MKYTPKNCSAEIWMKTPAGFYRHRQEYDIKLGINETGREDMQ
jgi:hypothetical protein